MSTIYEEIYLDESEFLQQFDHIIDSLTDETNTVWIIDHKVAFIPVHIYEELTSLKVDLSSELSYGSEGPQAPVHKPGS
jgi:hypothetical protein